MYHEYHLLQLSRDISRSQVCAVEVSVEMSLFEGVAYGSGLSSSGERCGLRVWLEGSKVRRTSYVRMCSFGRRTEVNV